MLSCFAKGITKYSYLCSTYSYKYTNLQHVLSIRLIIQDSFIRIKREIVSQQVKVIRILYISYLPQALYLVLQIRSVINIQINQLSRKRINKYLECQINKCRQRYIKEGLSQFLILALSLYNRFYLEFSKLFRSYISKLIRVKLTKLVINFSIIRRARQYSLIKILINLGQDTRSKGSVII